LAAAFTAMSNTFRGFNAYLLPLSALLLLGGAALIASVAAAC
jgi:hypothetical protein